MRFVRFLSPLLMLACFALPAAAQEKTGGKPADFFFKKGDVIVVMGDSITEQRLYSNYLELWSVTRFPDYKLVFRNVGIGGDRSTGGNSRFKRDVLAYKPTALTVDFGMNDGSYTKFSDKTFDPYMKGLQGIADQAKAANIRVAWITPQPTERAEPGNQLAGYNETLEKFSEGVGAIAKKNDGLFVDQFHPYLNVMNKARATDDKIRVTGGDAVHPGPTGQSLMAASILKGMNFPRAISSVSIDAAGDGVAETKNCKIEAVDRKNGIRFTRIDSALPFFPEQAKGILKWAPLLEEMNDYGLKVANLPAGRYDVLLGGKKAAEYSAEELAAGVNLAGPALTVGPIADQVKAVVKVVNDKTNFFHDQIFRGIHLNGNLGKDPAFKGLDAKEIAAKKEEMLAERLAKMPELDAAIHAASQPRPCLVEIVLSKATK